LNLQFVKAWVNLQECINSTVTAADLQGSLTIVQSFIAHSVRGASYIQSHSNLVVATLQIKYHCMFSYFYQWHLLLLMFESASHKFTPHTICGCTCSPNVFRFKAFLWNVKVKNFTMCLNNPAKIYGHVKL